jgi:hypothetical protein
MPLSKIHRFRGGASTAAYFIAELLDYQGKAQDDKLIIFGNEKSQIIRHALIPHLASMVLRNNINFDATARLCFNNNVWSGCDFAIDIPV